MLEYYVYNQVVLYRNDSQTIHQDPSLVFMEVTILYFLYCFPQITLTCCFFCTCYCFCFCCCLCCFGCCGKCRKEREEDEDFEVILNSDSDSPPASTDSPVTSQPQSPQKEAFAMPAPPSYDEAQQKENVAIPMPPPPTATEQTSLNTSDVPKYTDGSYN